MQQVNLYVPELRPQRDWLNANQAGLAAAALVVILVVMQWAYGMRADGLQEQVDQDKAAAAVLQVRVDKHRATATAADARSFDRTIGQLHNAIANREKVGRILSGQNIGNAAGFHAGMTSLARQAKDNLALDRFTFSRGGNYVEMHGQTRSAKAVPLYLQRLKSEPAFRQARFGLLSLAEQSRGGTLEFALGYDNVYRETSAEGEAR